MKPTKKLTDLEKLRRYEKDQERRREYQRKRYKEMRDALKKVTGKDGLR